MAYFRFLYCTIPFVFFAFQTLSSPLAVSIAKRATSAYAPVDSTCPTNALVRPANGISSAESDYITARKAVASTALASWLTELNGNFSTASLPSVGLTTSGGGYRSLLEGAGVIQAFDSRDSDVGTSGVYQGITYHSGLSGGAWLVSSLAGNDYPTVSSLKTGLWETAFQNDLFFPDGAAFAVADAAITNDVAAKNDAGFPPTLTDPWGRLISYQLLYGPDGGVSDRLSAIAAESSFISNAAPYPIITAIEVSTGQCLPTNNNPQFEIHPYEFGSWDSGIAAFAQTAYLGTSMTNGVPTTPGACIQNYDNLGYVFGTSSSLFSTVCVEVPTTNSSNPLIAALEDFLPDAAAGLQRDDFAVYPNPFFAYPSSPDVADQEELELVDGGSSNQNNPIWPFIQPARSGVIDVLIVNDNSADTSDNFPNGTEIYTTYQRAQDVGLSRMPQIPPVATFVAEGLNKRATFFGCNDSSVLTIVYLPNVNYTYPSNQPTLKSQYTVAETDAMIANGVQIGTQNGDAEWPVCLGCALVMKTGEAVPAECAACFEKYCWDS